MDTYVVMYRSFEHGLWLSSKNENIPEEHYVNAKEKAIARLAELDTKTSRILDAKILNPKGDLMTLNGFSDRHREHAWETYWTDRTHDLTWFVKQKA